MPGLRFAVTGGAGTLLPLPVLMLPLPFCSGHAAAAGVARRRSRSRKALMNTEFHSESRAKRPRTILRTVKGALPGWAVDNAESVQREAAPYRAMTVDERARILRDLCRASLALIASRADRERVLAWRDPVPESTRVAFARLRKQRSGA